MNETDEIVLAGGCFWCTEAVYQQVRGVLEVQSGYSNGLVEKPTYEQVCTGRTGCAEVVKLRFDPSVIDVRQILEIFFVVHDPTQLNRQGNDVGTQYRSAIFYTTEAQKMVAQALLDELRANDAYEGATIVTELAPVAHFWPAERVHDSYVQNNPQQGYCMFVALPKVQKFRDTFKALAR